MQRITDRNGAAVADVLKIRGSFCAVCGRVPGHDDVILVFPMPYQCLVHPACVQSFDFNKEDQGIPASRTAVLQEMLTAHETMRRFLTGKYATGRMPAAVLKALWRIIGTHYADTPSNPFTELINLQEAATSPVASISAPPSSGPRRQSVDSPAPSVSGPTGRRRRRRLIRHPTSN